MGAAIAHADGCGIGTDLCPNKQQLTPLLLLLLICLVIDFISLHLMHQQYMDQHHQCTPHLSSVVMAS